MCVSDVLWKLQVGFPAEAETGEPEPETFKKPLVGTTLVEKKNAVEGCADKQS